MKIQSRTVYGIMAAGGLVGTIASSIQLIDKMALLQNKDVALSCNLNSVFSCSTVLDTWQSSVFGLPNSMISLVFFVFFGAIALVGLSGGSLSRKLRLWNQGLAVFMLGFALWFLLQSTYVISSLCILCMFSFTGLLLINWGWLRLNVGDLPVSKKTRKVLVGWTEKGTDTFIWILIAVVLGLLMVQHFI